MNQWLNLYGNLIREGKQWSWSIVAVAAIVAGLILRQFALYPIFTRLKRLPRDTKKKIDDAYVKKSIWGWGCFILSVSLLAALFLAPDYFERWLPILSWELIGLILFFGALLCHGLAYATAAWDVMQSKLAPNQDFS